MTPLLTQFCLESYTLEDVYRRLGLFESFFESELYLETTSTLSLRDRFSAVTHGEAEANDVLVCTRLPDSVWSFFTRENITGALTELKKEIDMLPLLDIYAPVTFDEASKVHVGTWVRANVDARIMLRLHVEPTTVGGCQFAYHNTLHSDTLHTRMEKNKGMVTRILSSYA